MKRSLAVLLCFLCSTAFAQLIDVQHYRFELELTDRSDAITGKATIAIKMLQDASRISFDLASIDNDKGMYAFDVRDNGVAVHWVHEQDQLMIDLGTIAKKGELHSIEINYMGTPKDGLIIAKNKHGDRTFFGDNWPNRAHNWIPCNDRPDDKASFEFFVTAPEQYRVISNGLEMGEETLDGHRKRTHWRENTPLSTKVMVIGVAHFAVKEFLDSPPGLPVTAWVYPQDSANGFYDYGVAPSIVKFFSDYIAPFPYRKLANVQSKTIFGGMENASAIFYSEESVTGNRKWEDVLAHEIVHQWFGDMASEKSFAHLWLSEGFATYLTDIYIEKKYGKDSAAKRLAEARMAVIRFTQSNSHPIVDSTKDLLSLLNANSYEKGGWVLHMLRQEVGDSLFHRIIQTYYKDFKGSNADTRDFEAVAERVTQKDLRWFFDQWLYRPGLPSLNSRVTEKNGELTVTIIQKGEPYQLPLEIALVSADGTRVIKEVLVRTNEESFTFKVAGKTNVEIDPDHKLLLGEIIKTR
jgi:aminopeptidase N